MRQSTHCSRDAFSASSYEQNEIEGIYIPPMPCLLTKKWKCKQVVGVTDRRELSMIKLSL